MIKLSTLTEGKGTGRADEGGQGEGGGVARGGGGGG